MPFTYPVSYTATQQEIEEQRRLCKELQRILPAGVVITELSGQLQLAFPPGVQFTSPKDQLIADLIRAGNNLSPLYEHGEFGRQVKWHQWQAVVKRAAESMFDGHVPEDES